VLPGVADVWTGYSEEMELYSLRSESFEILRDTPEHLDFHVKTGDYFAYLATMLGFIEESLKHSDKPESEEERALIQDLRKDLCFMNSRYCIAAKPEDKISPIRQSGNLLASE
jgi:hypothetical protein